MKIHQLIALFFLVLSWPECRAQSPIAESKGNFCFLNHEKIQASAYPVIQTQHPVFADFNQDGHTDIAYLANNENKLFIQLNTGNPSPVFTNSVFSVHYHFNYNSGNAVAGDFNNDGKADLATIDYFGNVFTFRNNSLMNFIRDSIMSSITGSGFYGKLYPIQLDNDNRPDLLSVSMTASPVPGIHFPFLRTPP